MRHGQLFSETLESLGIAGIHTDGFSPEQIFYQIEAATADRISEIECDVNRQYKRRLRENASALADNNDCNNDCDVNGVNSVGNDEDNDISVSNDNNDNNDDNDGNNENNDESCSDYESIDEEEIKDVDWDSSASSYDELMNQPADVLLEALKSKDADFQKHRRNM